MQHGRQRLDDNMHVIWHDTPHKESIALAIEETQGVRDDAGNIITLQLAGPISAPQKPLDGIAGEFAQTLLLIC